MPLTSADLSHHTVQLYQFIEKDFEAQYYYFLATMRLIQLLMHLFLKIPPIRVCSVLMGDTVPDFKRLVVHRRTKTNDQTLRSNTRRVTTEFSQWYHGSTCETTHSHRRHRQGAPYTQSCFHKRLTYCIACGKANHMHHKAIVFRLLNSC
jgi:hypothetical protein